MRDRLVTYAWQDQVTVKIISLVSNTTAKYKQMMELNDIKRGGTSLINFKDLAPKKK